MDSRYAPDEIGPALRLSRGTAMARLGQSVQLAQTLADTRALWEAGRVDAAKVRAICEATFFLTAELAAAVQARVLDRAPEQSLAQLKAALARAVLAVDPEGAAARHRAARRDRRVCVGQESEGMASLWALLAAPDALSAYEWLTRLARGLGTDDPRKMDERRADLLVELLTGQLTIVPTDQADPASEPAVAEPATVDSAAEPAAAEPAVDPHTDHTVGSDQCRGANQSTDTDHSADTGSGAKNSRSAESCAVATRARPVTDTGSRPGAGFGSASSTRPASVTVAAPPPGFHTAPSGHSR